jgi:hypothetical protein
MPRATWGPTSARGDLGFSPNSARRTRDITTKSTEKCVVAASCSGLNACNASRPSDCAPWPNTHRRLLGADWAGRRRLYTNGDDSYDYFMSSKKVQMSRAT